MKKLIIATLITTASFAGFTKSLTCTNDSEIDMGFISIKLETKIEKVEDNHYIASERTLDLYMGDQGEDWAWYEYQGNVSEPIQNVTNYRPRKYIGHMKFHYDDKLSDMREPNIYNRRFFGSFDLLIPQEALDEAQSGDIIYAPVIMSYVSDHWGGSRTLECIVK